MVFRAKSPQLETLKKGIYSPLLLCPLTHAHAKDPVYTEYESRCLLSGPKLSYAAPASQEQRWERVLGSVAIWAAGCSVI